MSIKISKAKEELQRSINVFREGVAFPENLRTEVYRQLKDIFKIEISSSILISWIPEGGELISGYLINQNGELCFFDIDGGDELRSGMEKCSIDEYRNRKEFTATKPWDYLVLALDLYAEEYGLKKAKNV